MRMQYEMRQTTKQFALEVWRYIHFKEFLANMRVSVQQHFNCVAVQDKEKSTFAIQTNDSAKTNLWKKKTKNKRNRWKVRENLHESAKQSRAVFAFYFSFIKCKDIVFGQSVCADGSVSLWRHAGTNELNKLSHRRERECFFFLLQNKWYKTRKNESRRHSYKPPLNIFFAKMKFMAI